jgi:hypothetical protein
VAVAPFAGGQIAAGTTTFGAASRFVQVTVPADWVERRTRELAASIVYVSVVVAPFFVTATLRWICPP